MTDRDDLAALIARALVRTRPNHGDSIEDLPPHQRHLWLYRAGFIADAILAAGWRKPRTITTRAELSSLPGDSVILCDEAAWQVSANLDANDRRWSSTYSGYAPCRDADVLPALVLWIPEERA